MPERKIERLIYRWRVRAGLAALILTLAFSRPTPRSLLAFVAVGLIGLLIRAWASGHLKKDKELATSGPYGFTRNPLYLGNFVLGIGLALGACSWPALAVFAVYFLVFYSVTIARERRRMKELFPDGYADYRSRVPLFFPSLRRPRPSPVKFSWGLYLKNKEYRALAGMVGVALLLLAKMLLIG
jgi:protein-S-isoprenylcysteine O-methyltransferase Ste14